MFRHNMQAEFPRSAAAQWLVLTFLAGSVNAGGFVAYGRFVTHMTGFATLAGVGAARGAPAEALAALSVPGFFVAGVMAAAWLTARRKRAGLAPRYAATMLLVGACLAVVAIGGSFKAFGPFGGAFDPQHTFGALALLCLASGLQNAAVTTSSGATVRTTHLTGVTTDLGIGLVELIAFRGSPRERAVIWRNCRHRLATIFAFALGSTLGGALFLRVGYPGFFLPAAIAFYAALVARRKPGTVVAESRTGVPVAPSPTKE